MITIIRTNHENLDFQTLVNLLDVELQARYGEAQAYYDQFNSLNVIPYVVVAYLNGQLAGCGAIKPFDKHKMEIKRVYVKQDQRGKGIAQTLLAELEKWATELNYKACVLETGDLQHEAIALYKDKLGYEVIPNYGQYAGMESSICMKKML